MGERCQWFGVCVEYLLLPIYFYLRCLVGFWIVFHYVHWVGTRRAGVISPDVRRGMYFGSPLVADESDVSYSCTT